jgi:hypothetical protein
MSLTCVSKHFRTLPGSPWIQAGIVSYLGRCAQAKFFDVCTRWPEWRHSWTGSGNTPCQDLKPHRIRTPQNSIEGQWNACRGWYSGACNHVTLWLNDCRALFTFEFVKSFAIIGLLLFSHSRECSTRLLLATNPALFILCLHRRCSQRR